MFQLYFQTVHPIDFPKIFSFNFFFSVLVWF